MRLRDQWPGADPGSGLALGSHRAVSGTDLGLLDLEVLVVVIDNGVFGAAGPDEADALEQNTMTKNDETWYARAALEGRFLEKPPLLTCPLPPRCPHAGSHPPPAGKGRVLSSGTCTSPDTPRVEQPRGYAAPSPTEKVASLSSRLVSKWGCSLQVCLAEQGDPQGTLVHGSVALGQDPVTQLTLSVLESPTRGGDRYQQPERPGMLGFSWTQSTVIDQHCRPRGRKGGVYPVFPGLTSTSPRRQRQDQETVPPGGWGA